MFGISQFHNSEISCGSFKLFLKNLLSDAKLWIHEFGHELHNNHQSYKIKIAKKSPYLFLCNL